MEVLFEVVSSIDVYLKSIPVQVPAIETCFMSIDEEARIFSKSSRPYIGGELRIFSCTKASGNTKEIWRNFFKSQGLRGSSEFFQVPEIWRNMKEIWRNIWEIWRNIWKIKRTLPIYEPWDSEKFQAHPLIYGPGGGGSQFQGLWVTQRKHEVYFKKKVISSIKIL